MITKGQIVDAYTELASAPGRTVRIWHLRDHMGDPAGFDEALLAMHRTKLVCLSEDRYSLSDAERAAAVYLDGQPMHLMILGDLDDQ
jgi:hypothetical protein